jgi:hypothetical protein
MKRLLVVTSIFGALSGWGLSARAQSIEVLLSIANPNVICNEFEATVWVKERTKPQYDVGLMRAPKQQFNLDECSKPGTRVGIRPNSFSYRTPPEQFCTAGEISFQLQRRDFSCEAAKGIDYAYRKPQTRSLAVAMIDAADRDNAADAAFASNELLARLKGELPGEVTTELESYYAIQTGLAVQAALNQPVNKDNWTRFDPNQNKVVLTGNGVDGLKEFQRIRNLPQTGQADWMTLQTLSGKSYGDLNKGYGAIVGPTS